MKVETLKSSHGHQKSGNRSAVFHNSAEEAKETSFPVWSSAFSLKGHHQDPLLSTGGEWKLVGDSLLLRGEESWWRSLPAQSVRPKTCRSESLKVELLADVIQKPRRSNAIRGDPKRSSGYPDSNLKLKLI
eukprot:TRINITY_DN3192_c0_g1_i1.p1 TRINITY_DN3192_c0_g1~~TRINITY_DN3192_c0_g1_i1.p1  ORF type:complete len:131 (-),score=2.09 TRINITY_DN3192_c0_g1_i1:17-409(-)